MIIHKNTNKIPVTKAGINSIQETTGIYIFKQKNTILYIGKSVNLKARLLSHLENAKLDLKEAAIVNNADAIEYIITDSEFKALFLESRLIQSSKPKYNSRWRDDKSYLYIKISVQDRYPKIFPVRRENDGQSLYYGPFPSLRHVEELLREIRKVLPFCTQKKLSKRSCFYSKIGLCKPCPNHIEHSSQEERKILAGIYRHNIRQILKIFDGQSELVLNNLYKKLKVFIKLENYEEAMRLRDKIYRLEYLIHDRVFTGNIATSYNQSEEQILDLVKLLHSYFPSLHYIKRMECYDISNLSQKDATASMVVFTDGMPDKSEYKRFKIRNTRLQSDFDMLEEVSRRRFKRDWEEPDLIIIDGGRPQIRRINEVMTSLKKNVPLIGIAKHPDRLVINIDGLPVLKPPIHRPGFILIRAIRDESHRFARKYHLLLRSKRMGL